MNLTRILGSSLKLLPEGIHAATEGTLFGGVRLFRNLRALLTDYKITLIKSHYQTLSAEVRDGSEMRNEHCDSSRGTRALTLADKSPLNKWFFQTGWNLRRKCRRCKIIIFYHHVAITGFVTKRLLWPNFVQMYVLLKFITLLLWLWNCIQIMVDYQFWWYRKLFRMYTIKKINTAFI